MMIINNSEAKRTVMTGLATASLPPPLTQFKKKAKKKKRQNTELKLHFIILLPKWDFSHGKFGALPRGKPAATESRYSTYDACSGC